MTRDGLFSGKVALITGAAGGIGEACAIRFAREGAHVVAADIRSTQSTVDRVRSFSGECLSVEVDVTSADDCERMVSMAIERFGRLDFGVAAAGIVTAKGPSDFGSSVTVSGFNSIVSGDVRSFRRVIECNLVGTFNTNRSLAREMIRAKNGGCIINVGSMAARVAYAGGSAYCASKAGIAMLTEVLALEVADQGVRVNLVNPGFIDTSLTADIRQDDTAFSAVMKRVPLGRFGTTEEVASACVFLCSEDASFFTGATLCPSGGYGVG